MKGGSHSYYGSREGGSSARREGPDRNCSKPSPSGGYELGASVLWAFGSNGLFSKPGHSPSDVSRVKK